MREIRAPSPVEELHLRAESRESPRRGASPSLPEGTPRRSAIRAAHASIPGADRPTGPSRHLSSISRARPVPRPRLLPRQRLGRPEHRGLRHDQCAALANSSGSAFERLRGYQKAPEHPSRSRSRTRGRRCCGPTSTPTNSMSTVPGSGSWATAPAATSPPPWPCAPVTSTARRSPSRASSTPPSSTAGTPAPRTRTPRATCSSASPCTGSGITTSRTSRSWTTGASQPLKAADHGGLPRRVHRHRRVRSAAVAMASSWSARIDMPRSALARNDAGRAAFSRRAAGAARAGGGRDPQRLTRHPPAVRPGGAEELEARGDPRARVAADLDAVGQVADQRHAEASPSSRRPAPCRPRRR